MNPAKRSMKRVRVVLAALTELQRSMASTGRLSLAQYRVHLDVHVDEVKVLGDFAFDRATFSMTMQPKKGGPSQAHAGRVMELVRKEGGQWKSFRVMTN